LTFWSIGLDHHHIIFNASQAVGELLWYYT